MMSNGEASAADEASVEETIALAQRGQVAVTPERALDMARALFRQGKFREAERLCRQLLAGRPSHADALNLLGLALNALGERQQAIEALRRSTELAPRSSALFSNLGEVLRQAGDLDGAAEAVARAVEADPDNPHALNNFGIIHYERGEFGAAADCYRRALKLRGDMAEAHNNLGNALRRAGDLDGAAEAYRQALAHRSVYPEAFNNLGALLHERKALPEAEKALRIAVHQAPAYVEAHNNLATVCLAQNRTAEALAAVAQVLERDPRNVRAMLNAARAQSRSGELAVAEQAARLAIEQQPDNAEAWTVLGQLLHEANRYDEALAALERALQVAPEDGEALNAYGVTLVSAGRFDEARRIFEQLLASAEHAPNAFANLQAVVDFAGEDDLFERLQAAVRHSPASDPEALPLHFTYAKALDDRGEHERALQLYVEAGRIKRAALGYDEADVFGFFDAVRAAFPKARFEQRGFGGSDDARPVFIVGMPRSGSTLVEQILASHPQVHGGGEVKHLSRALGRLRGRDPGLPEYPQMMEQLGPKQMEILAADYLAGIEGTAGDARRVTDKLLTNFFFVGLINLLFPNAKIIHSERDPVDSCLSAFTKLFREDMPHSYDLAELGRYYGKYRELMQHWREVLPAGVMHSVAYEDVVADTEKAARELIAFVGLEWSDQCLDFHNSQRPVKTASAAQVRKPIYSESVGRWRRYGPGLQPLLDAMGRAAPPAAETA